MPHGTRIARRPLLVLSVLHLMSAVPAYAAPDADRIAALVPTGPTTVEILTPDYDQRSEAVAVRLHEAARRDPAWFQARARAHPDGRIPWDARLGVSREDYAHFLDSSQRAGVTVFQRATLTFERLEGRRWRLRGWGKLAPLDGVVLDLEANQVVTPRRGTLPWRGRLAPDPGRPTPVHWLWFGQWRSSHQVGDPARGGQALEASLSLGPTREGAAGLYWSYRRTAPGAKLADEFLLLRWTPQR